MRKVVIAVLFLAAAIGIALLFGIGFGGFGRDGGDGGNEARASRAKAEHGRTIDAVDATDEIERERGESNDGEVKVRRVKDADQRRRLLALIASAARARRSAQAADEEGGEPDGGRAKGSLSKDVIRAAVQAVIEDIKACYEKALEGSPRLSGKMVVEFEIVGEPDAGGAIETAKVLDETDDSLRANEELGECFLDAIYSLELPAPKSGGKVVVHYPFHLEPGDDREGAR